MTIPEILKTSKTIAVVGLSSRKFRPSYGVSQYMQEQGYRIIPVNPGESSVLGEKSYASLSEVPETIDIVNIFRRPSTPDPQLRIRANAFCIASIVTDRIWSRGLARSAALKGSGRTGPS